MPRSPAGNPAGQRERAPDATAALDAAIGVLHAYEDVFPDDDRLRDALEVAYAARRGPMPPDVVAEVSAAAYVGWEALIDAEREDERHPSSLRHYAAYRAAMSAYQALRATVDKQNPKAIRGAIENARLAAESYDGSLQENPAMPVDNPATRKELKAAFRDLDAKGITRVMRIIEKAEAGGDGNSRVHRIREAMQALNKELGTHGVESYHDEDGDGYVDYCNTGDMYASTVLYDWRAGDFIITSLGDWREKMERETAEMRAHDAQQYHDDIVEAICRTLWVSAYATWAEEQDDLDVERPRGGGDWDDYAPDPPESAERAGQMLAEIIELANGQRLTELLAQAIEANRGEGRALAYAGSDVAERFGSDLAMMALGTGVSWFDDNAEFTLTMPRHIEAYTFDGKTLDTSGIEPTTPDRTSRGRR